MSTEPREQPDVSPCTYIIKKMIPGLGELSPGGRITQPRGAHFCDHHCTFKLNARAQNFARHLARLGTLQHGVHQLDGKGRVGENLAAGSLSGARAVEEWYKEVDIYKTSRGGFSFNTGHFTQVLTTIPPIFLGYRVFELNFAPETEAFNNAF